MPNLGPTELIISAVILVLLSGAKKLPDTARAVGRSLRIFKAQTNKLREDDDKPAQTTTVTVQQQSAPAPASQQLPSAEPALSPEEQARRLEEEAARLRAQAAAAKDKTN